MLTIEFQEGQNRPIIRCDECNDQIDDAASASYYWQDPTDQRTTTQIFFVHTKCYSDFYDRTENDLGRLLGRSLMVFPIYVGHNMNINWDEAFAKIRDFG